MKKVIFAMAAVVALAACSKEDTIIADRGDAIGFGTPFVENSTRATDSTYGAVDLESFKVYGTVTGTAGTVNIYDGVVVTGTVGTADWSHAEQYNQYWIPGADYDFAAIVDATVATANTYGMPLTLTTQADTATEGNMNLKDMLYASAHVEDATANQGRVNFNFSHLLSKVKFTVTSNAMGGYYHTVTGIKISNFETGTYTIADGTWAGGAAKGVEFAEIANVTSATGALSNAELLLVPNAATFNVTFTVDLYKNDTKLGTETITKAVETDLVKGNSYNFTIACSVGNPIKFGVTNDPTWTTQPDVAIQ